MRGRAQQEAPRPTRCFMSPSQSTKYLVHDRLAVAQVVVVERPAVAGWWRGGIQVGEGRVHGLAGERHGRRADRADGGTSSSSNSGSRGSRGRCSIGDVRDLGKSRR